MSAALLFVRLVDESTGFLAPGHVEQFHRDLGASYTTLGVMMAMPYIGSLLGNVFVARSDHSDRKWIAVGGALTVAASMLVCALAADAVLLCVGGFAVGAGSTCLVEAGEIALTRVTDGPLERTLARMNLFAVVGDLITPLAIAATRAAGIEWRWLFVGAAVATFAYAWLLSTQTFPPPRPLPESDDAFDVEPPIPILKHRAVWWIGVAALITAPLDEPFLATVLAYAQDERNVSATWVMLLGAGFVAGGLVVFTALVGRLESMTAPEVLRVTAIVMAVTGAAVLVSPVWIIALVGFAHSAALDSQWLSLQAAALRVAPGREGRAGALIDVIELTSLGIPVLFGWVADQHGLGWSVACFAALPMLLILPARGLARSRRPTPEMSFQ